MYPSKALLSSGLMQRVIYTNFERDQTRHKDFASLSSNLSRESQLVKVLFLIS